MRLCLYFPSNTVYCLFQTTLPHKHAWSVLRMLGAALCGEDWVTLASEQAEETIGANATHQPSNHMPRTRRGIRKQKGVRFNCNWEATCGTISHRYENRIVKLALRHEIKMLGDRHIRICPPTVLWRCCVRVCVQVGPGTQKLPQTYRVQGGC